MASRLPRQDLEHAVQPKRKHLLVTHNRDITIAIPGTIVIKPPTLKAQVRCKLVSKVFHIPELLEQILSAVDNKTLRTAVSRVCKGFRDAIEGSIILKRELMFLSDWRCDRLWLTAPGFEQEAWLGLDERVARSGWSWRQISRDNTRRVQNKYDLTDNFQSIAKTPLATERIWTRPTAKLQLLVPGPLESIPYKARAPNSSLRRVLVCQPPVEKLRCRWSWSGKSLGCDGIRQGGAELSRVHNESGVTWGDVFDAMAGIEFGRPPRRREELGPVFLFQGYWDLPE